MSATILIPQFRVVVRDMLRQSFTSVKEAALAADTPVRTVERWWRGETCPNAAQWLLLTLNSDPFSARAQLLHDELKTRRTDVSRRLARLREARPREVATAARARLDGASRVGDGAGRGLPQAVRGSEARQVSA